jgi:hypothetical protein
MRWVYLARDAFPYRSGMDVRNKVTADRRRYRRKMEERAKIAEQNRNNASSTARQAQGISEQNAVLDTPRDALIAIRRQVLREIHLHH